MKSYEKILSDPNFYSHGVNDVIKWLGEHKHIDFENLKIVCQNCVKYFGSEANKLLQHIPSDGLGEKSYLILQLFSNIPLINEFFHSPIAQHINAVNDITRYLKASPEKINNLLLDAVEANDLHAAMIFLIIGGDPNSKDPLEFDEPLLLKSIYKADEDMICLLLEFGGHLYESFYGVSSLFEIYYKMPQTFRSVYRRVIWSGGDLNGFYFSNDYYCPEYQFLASIGFRNLHNIFM